MKKTISIDDCERYKLADCTYTRERIISKFPKGVTEVTLEEFFKFDVSSSDLIVILCCGDFISDEQLETAVDILRDLSNEGSTPERFVDSGRYKIDGRPMTRREQVTMFCITLISDNSDVTKDVLDILVSAIEESN